MTTIEAFYPSGGKRMHIQTRSQGLSSPPSLPTPGVHSVVIEILTLPGHAVPDS